jgi:hypothetical protein
LRIYQLGIRHHRAGDFIKPYRQLVAHHKGQVSAEVIVAEPLKDAQLFATGVKMKGARPLGKSISLLFVRHPASRKTCSAIGAHIP